MHSTAATRAPTVMDLPLTSEAEWIRCACEVDALATEATAQTLVYVEKLLARSEFSSPLPEAIERHRIDVMVKCAGIFLAAGKTRSAVAAGIKMKSLTATSSNPYLQRRAANVLGLALKELGAISGALTEYARAIPLARQAHDQSGLCTVYLNIASALNFLGYHGSAIEVATKALEVGADGKVWGEAFKAYQIIANAHNLLGNIHDGIIAIELARRGMPPPTSAFDCLQMARTESVRSQLYLKNKDIQAAREAAALSRQYATGSSSKIAAINAAIGEALIEIEDGNLAEAQSLLERLIPQLEGTNTEQTAVALAFIRLRELGNQPESALQALETLIQKLTEMRAGVVLRTYYAELEAEHQLQGQHLDLIDSLHSQRLGLSEAVVHGQQHSGTLMMLKRFAAAAHAADDESGTRICRVGRLAALLATALGHDAEYVADVEVAAMLCDVGKLNVPAAIYRKKAPLSEVERKLVRAHVEFGVDLIKKTAPDSTTITLEVTAGHHERWDGSGYPRGLIGPQIPIAAQIVGIADCFDAMTHERAWRPAMSVESALREIEAHIGAWFSPEITGVFSEMVRSVQADHENLEQFLSASAAGSVLAISRSAIEM